MNVCQTSSSISLLDSKNVVFKSKQDNAMHTAWFSTYLGYFSKFNKAKL